MPGIMLRIIGVIIMEGLPDRHHHRHHTNLTRSLINPAIIPTIRAEIINPEEGINRTHQNVPEGVVPVEIPVRRVKEDFADKNKDTKRATLVALFCAES